MIIEKAIKGDLTEILALQYLSFQSQAELLNNPKIPPLQQTFEAINDEYDGGVVFLKAIDDNGEIIGSVRGVRDNNTLKIGKLLVHPKKQGQGIGSALLKEIETAGGCTRYELFTSSKSESNLRLYRRAGYTVFKEELMADGIAMVYLEKRA